MFRIQYADKTGSSFTIEVDDRQYLITARHLVDGIKDGDSIQLRLTTGWKHFKVRPIYCDSATVDIIALALSAQLSPTFSLVPSAAGVIIAQDIYFLGFPYERHYDDAIYTRQSGWPPIAFVKKGILSAIDFRQPSSSIYYIDGHNNRGFSGGPVVFVDNETKALKVAGVVSAYLPELEKVKEQSTGKVRDDLFAEGNSGILVAHGIRHIVEAIKERPIGPVVKE